MKLSLNKPALERLLAGDSELEIELRHQVVNEFAKHHLVELTRTEAFKQIREEFSKIENNLMKQIQAEISRQIGHYASGGWLGCKEKLLTDEIRLLVSKLADKAVQEAIDKSIKGRIEAYEKSWAKVINDKVEAVFAANIKKLVDAEWAKRLEAVTNPPRA